MMREHLLYEKKDHIAYLTLNRPEVYNAFSVPMLERWSEALEDAQNSPEIRVIILRGKDKVFCTGGDVKAMLDNEGFLGHDQDKKYWGSTALARKNALWKLIHKVPLLLESIDKPIIASIDGIALGAGLDMALMCDIRIASDTAKFSTGYVKMGLLPGDGGAYFLPRLVGVAKALELLLTGEFFDAEKALKYGVVNRVVAHSELENETLKLANSIADNPPISIQIIKRAIYQSLDCSLRMHLDYICSQMAIVSELEDHKEGLNAFKEKRNPLFKGK